MKKIINHKISRIGVVLFIAPFIFFVSLIILFYSLTTLPNVDLNNIKSKESIIFLDRNENFLFDFSPNKKKVYIKLDDIAPSVINATIAIEDKNFYEHNGVVISSFIRAVLTNVATLSFRQGGSTITQQVIKNIFLTGDKKITRKAKEFILAPKLEKILSKNEIIELYLNTIPYGGVTYGIGEASNSFYNKKPKDLTIAESAYLAAVLKAPTYFSPFGNNRDELETRKQIILEKMFTQKMISREEYENAIEENVFFQDQKAFAIKAPHFVFFAKETLEKEFGEGLSEFEGKSIKTTLDLQLQNIVEKIIEKESPNIEKRFGAKNIASLVLDTETGDILSLVGSRDFFDKEIDGSVNIINSLRQPGSTFKPFVYASLLNKKFTPETVLYDVATQFSLECDKDVFETRKTTDKCYSPVNYTGEFLGPVKIKEALAQSINVPAVKSLYLAEIKNVLDLTKNFGITSLNLPSSHYGLPLAIGSAEIKPIELAQAFMVFANSGKFIPYQLFFDEKIDRKRVGEQVIDKNIALSINEILSDDKLRSPIFGRNSSLNIQQPQVAVKTGTTNNSRDIWVIGYSPKLVVLVWAGNAKGEILNNNASGFSLARIFKDIMLIASDKYGYTNFSFESPTNKKFYSIDIINGIIDKDAPRTLLHYVDKNGEERYSENLTYTDEDGEIKYTDEQYERWEYGLEKWLEENKIGDIDETFEEDEFKYEIILPEKNSLIDRNTHTIIQINSRGGESKYEFYINGEFIKTSHIPFFSKKINTKGERTNIRVIIYKENETFIVEKDFKNL